MLIKTKEMRIFVIFHQKSLVGRREIYTFASIQEKRIEEFYCIERVDMPGRTSIYIQGIYEECEDDAMSHGYN